MEKAVMMLSGGLDSVVSLTLARKEHEVVSAITFDYGQRAAARELAAAMMVANHYDIPHQAITLPWLREVTATALVDPSKPMPDSDFGAESAASVWVPNRNGVFINICAALAEGLGAGWVITGFNREEAATFPDNSQQFVEAANHALSFSTMNGVKVISFTSHMTKKQILLTGRDEKAPLQMTWSCYEGGAEPCRKCESCSRRKNVESA